ncbi:hypothetical protein AP058_00501 [Flavobacterium sp. TAB 87]|nr:hypothetical protein AP058_00501 [Flavobacterium sp. TAB 87]
MLAQGYEVPAIFGDPALLLPRYFNPKVEKKYRLGIIPHYNDAVFVDALKLESADVCVISMMTNDIEGKTIEFLQCEKIISSSLHGIIVAHAYGIPAVWQRFSDQVFGDDIKYQDYFESVALESYKPSIQLKPYADSELAALFNKYPNLPEKQVLENLRNGLMEVCLFL